MLDLVFSPICLGCGGAISTAREERLVCATCRARTRPLPEPRCPRCWHPLSVQAGDFSPCSLCPELPPALRVLRSALVLEEPVRALVHALKYAGWQAVARPLGGYLAALPVPLDVEEEVRWVVPVPLSAVRLRERGYNQAELLARETATRRGWALAPDVLIRGRSTETQTALHPAERRANVAGAFAVPTGRSEALRGEHVLLVDDVWTTGSTALACTESLLRAGVRAVSVFTLARAMPELHRAERQRR